MKRKRRKATDVNFEEELANLGLLAIGTESGNILLYSVTTGDLHKTLVCLLL